MTTALALTALATSINGFTPTIPSSSLIPRTQTYMAAIDVASETEFDKKISDAGDKLVVIDYSTTWCGPCKVIAPKFDELSDKYSDSIFIKVSCLVEAVNVLTLYMQVIFLILLVHSGLVCEKI